MTTRQKISKIPAAIQNALLEKILTREHTNEELTQWLLKQHGKKIGVSPMWRHSKAMLAHYGSLIDLGMPIHKLIRERHKIDALGIERVKQMLIEKIEEEAEMLVDFNRESEA